MLWIRAFRAATDAVSCRRVHSRLFVQRFPRETLIYSSTLREDSFVEENKNEEADASHVRDSRV